MATPAFIVARFGSSCALLLASLLLSTPVSAQWQHIPDGVPVADAPTAQDDPEIVSDGAGGAIIVWRETRTDTGWDLYAQRIDDEGLPRWGPDGVPVAAEVGQQYVHRLVADGSGGVFVSWNDKRSGDFDVYAQWLNGEGSAQWMPGGVAISSAPGDQFGANAVPDGEGGWILAWSDRRLGAVALEDVYAQRIDGSGVLQWAADGVPLCTATGRQSLANGMVSDGAGGAIATWMDLRTGVGAWDLYTQRVNGFGVVQWTVDGLALSTTSTNERNTGSLPDGTGGAIILWVDDRNGQDDLYAQRIDSSGARLWTPGGVPVAVAPNNKFNPRIVSDGAGGALIAWHDFRAGSTDADIYVQRVDATGVPRWALNGIALCAQPGHQFYPDLAPDGAGGAFVTWADQRNGSDWQVYVQRIDAGGDPQWPGDGTGLVGGIPLMRGPNPGQCHPKVVADGLGGAIVTWHDTRDGDGNIYAQRVLGEGPTGVRGPAPASSLAILGIRPNPLSGRATLRFELHVHSSVLVELFDVAGRRVRRLSRHAMTGMQSLVLDGRNDAGQPLANGIYFCRVSAAGTSRTVKMTVMR